MADDASRVTGLVLAGGEGRRMGGADKGLLELDGQPLVSLAAARLRPQVGSIIVSANRNLERYRALGFEVVTDTVDDGARTAGPLAGLLAGLGRCATPWLAVVPCDSPDAPTDLVERLQSGALAASAPAALAVSESGAHPVFMLVSRQLLPDLQAFLNEGGRRIREWQDRVGAVAVPFPDEAAFANINTSADLERHT